MKKAASLVLLLSALTLPLSAQSKAPTTKELYGSMCQACHGPDGKAPIKEMGFVGRTWKHGKTATDSARVIRDGVPKTVMMPFKGRLTEAQIAALAKHVRALDKKK
ncbi:MAG: cytochrome c [Acidobacteriota bacterium]|nr:cytochrome c [Acidobacteriota bacterium]